MSPRSVACPCCGYLVFKERGGWEICPICYWEDDPVQIADPWCPGGANRPCLEESQRNYAAYGAMEQRFVEYVRAPNSKDVQDPNWRSVQATDRETVTTPREIEEKRDAGSTVPYEYWMRTKP